MSEKDDVSRSAQNRTEFEQAQAMRKASETRAPRAQFKSLSSPADLVRTVHHLKAELGVKLEQLLEPAFWCHITKNLKPLDIIEVNAEDGSYFAMLQVRSASKLEAVCEILMVKNYDPIKRVAQQEGKEYGTRYGSPASGWQVYRVADKMVMKDGFLDEAQAQAWLDGHLREMAA